ncbi:kappa-scoloptoxin(11)-Ss1a-like isoform X2 [Paramacrobiotus metropolitanus]|uniref:kappa-scoloptoxin(11)-Ss1a-like isoform X2 n=1 Tax=Paramacrobiotus metropolitanus TaxID=2943436 RepID=UPI0024456374|nr:kappa-scoloptoxin(11)-Ss1a-like isoform X2 [Paramacrobiotus metropolitanus]
MQQSALWSVTLLVTFICSLPVRADTVNGVNADDMSESQKQAALQWLLRRVSKRGTILNKCEKHSACALLQTNPASASYWIDEICYCGDGAKCNLEWSDGADGKAVNNGDTQLKLCQPVTTMPKCSREQTAVTTAMETSVQNPAIKQSASVFCNCPRINHEYKLIDAGMVDEGDRTVVTAHFGCASSTAEPVNLASF